MSFSSGTFSLFTPGNPVVTGTTISSTWANNTLTDIATGLSTCVLKDGTQTTTASVPFALGISVTGAPLTMTTQPINEAVQASIASGATVNLDSAASNYVQITGTTTITAITLSNGRERTVEFSGGLTITNGGSLICPGGVNLQVTPGDVVTFRGEASNVVRIVNAPRTGQWNSVPRSALAGLTLSTAGSSTTMTTAAGQAADSTNAAVMTLTSSIGKTTSAWSVGTGNGGLDTGAIANSTWYHFYVIQRVDTGVVDVLFSLSASAPTMPANYTLKRRIGSGLTNGSGQWTKFVQDGDFFQWDVPPALDVNATNPGTSAVTTTVAVPTGVNVMALLNAEVVSTTNATDLLFSDLAITDTSPASNATPLGQIRAIANTSVMGQVQVRTNTSAQVRYRVDNSDAGTVVRAIAVGWFDTRGKLA